MRKASAPRRYRVPLLVGAVLCAGTTAVSTGAVRAARDPDRASELAQAQFQVYLLTETELRPMSITCTSPNPVVTTGELVCYAMVNERDTISAVATLGDDDVYTFAAIGKLGRESTDASPQTPAGPGTPDTSGTPTGTPTEADLRVDVFMEAFNGDEEILTDSLVENNELEVTVDSIAWQPDVATLAIEVSADADADADLDLDQAAWVITDTVAWAWEAETPPRRDDATLLPRLEVSIDGTIYGTPYEVMVRVADYDITPDEWLDITTNAGTLRQRRTQHAGRAVSSADDDRAARRAPHPAPAAGPASAPKVRRTGEDTRRADAALVGRAALQA